MKSYIFRTRNVVYTAILIAGISFVAQAQEPGDDVMIKAMQDELNRSMKELKLPDHEKPFFMMYGVLDQKSYTILATLGSIGQSMENSGRVKTNIRILVGDYSFNDESLDTNQSGGRSAVEIPLPLDNDYYGIRRALWSTTDKVYRDAAKNLEKHKETLKELGKTVGDVPHRWFASSEPVRIISTLKSNHFDKASWEITARNLSKRFISHPMIYQSSIVINYMEGYKYLVSSEGTVVRTPFNHASFITYAQGKNKEGELTNGQIAYYATTSDQLPSEQKLQNEIDSMIVRMEKQFDLPKFKDEYTGPVMVTGKAVANLFASVLRNGKESIYASDNIPKLKGLQFEEDPNSMENKIGKSVMNEFVTIKVKPKLKSYNGAELLGNFEIDAEGIIPPDELIIVDKGILKNLLNNRTLTSTSQKANGFSAGPGVVEITMTQKNSEKALKEKLIAQAKKEGLDYAIVIRDDGGFNTGSMNVYKVSVADGKEELVRNAVPGAATLKTLKRILGASEKSQVHTLRSNRNFESQPELTSLIVPEAIVVEEMDVKPQRSPSLKEKDYVSNPLGE